MALSDLGGTIPFSEEQILRYVESERQDSIGFDNEGDELVSAREKALEYYKGEMKDIPALEKRSKVTSSDVSDAIETVLPDLMEVFFGGDDVVTFRPEGDEDIEQAEQETDALRQVVVDENPGFLHFYQAIKDALLTRLGVFHFWWEGAAYDEQEREVNVLELHELQHSGVEVIDIEEPEAPEDVFKVRVKVLKHKGKACFEAIASEDFAFARDTVFLRDTTYCAMRSRKRVQELIVEGYDQARVEDLPPHDGTDQEEIDQARDNADETDFDNEGAGMLRSVEITRHVIKLLKPQTTEFQYYSVITGDRESVLLDIEEIEYVPFSAFSPFPAAFRLLGRSLADMMIEVQKIKTSLLRMLLDSGNFALNQRVEVAESEVGKYTLKDLINNIPGAPVRTKTGQGLKPISAGALNFDVMGALETIDVMGEKRSGVMRFGQGLKADTLHDTASGALEMAANAMKRVRLIARIIAEFGVKDLFLGLHTVMRLHSTHDFKVRRGKKFVPIDPTAWGQRQDMSIEIAIGSGGRREQIADLEAIGDSLGAALDYQAKGAIDAPIVNSAGVHAFYHRYFKARGQKAPELFLTDPAEAPPQQPQADPAQMQAQMQVQEAAAKLQLEQQKMQMEGDIKREQIQAEAQLKREQMAAETQLKREQMAAETQLKREQMMAEIELSREERMARIAMQERLGSEKNHLNGSGNVSDVRMGGEVG